MDARLAKRTLGRIYREAKVGTISFSGGEPSLLDNIQDLALKCRFNGSSVNILTNGTLVSGEDIGIFHSIGVSAVQIPLLSNDPAVHDYLTGLPGSWGKAVKSIRNVLDIMGPEHFAAVLILTARNVDGLEDTLEMYRTMGVKSVMVNRFNLGGNGLKNKAELNLSRDSLKASFKVVSDFAMENPVMNFVSGVCTPLCLLDPVDFPGIRFTSCSTDVKTRPLAISYSGDVRFCNHSPFVLGNIWERSLKEILEDESTARRYSSVPDECVQCALYNRCKGGCRAASEQVYGSFDRVDPIMQTD